ncbi:MAG: DUF6465 family protein [Lachnospira sp.]|nr:DUF6465 family protein [Lachnospira sp.]
MSRTRKTTTASKRTAAKGGAAVTKEPLMADALKAEEKAGKAAETVEKKAEAVKENAEKRTAEVKKAAEEKTAEVKKAAEEKTAEVRKAVEKAGKEVKEAVAEKKEEVKKAVKAPARAARAKKAAKAEPLTKVFFQYMGGQVDQETLVKKVVDDANAQGVDVSSVKLYVKPEEGKCYYVANDNFMGAVDLF